MRILSDDAALMIRDARIEDLPQMLTIYNKEVRTSAATFDVDEQTYVQRKDWFFEHGEKFPLIVGEIWNKIVGYCSISPFREKASYSKTIESSVYVEEASQGLGIGKLLLEEILRRASELGYHAVIGVIAGDNEASIKLHSSLGFQFIGHLKEVGFKFGKWQDVKYYQLLLQKPSNRVVS